MIYHSTKMGDLENKYLLVTKTWRTLSWLGFLKRDRSSFSEFSMELSTNVISATWRLMGWFWFLIWKKLFSKEPEAKETKWMQYHFSNRKFWSSNGQNVMQWTVCKLCLKDIIQNHHLQLGWIAQKIVDLTCFNKF